MRRLVPLVLLLACTPWEAAAAGGAEDSDRPFNLVLSRSTRPRGLGETRRIDPDPRWAHREIGATWHSHGV